MSKRDRLSHDQKRKAKLKKKAERSRGQESLAYKGNKYKTDELVPFMFRTEVGIHEAHVITDRELKDDTVEAALVHLITRLRQGPLPELPWDDTLQAGPTEEDRKNLVVANILRNWRIYTEKSPLPPKDSIIGVLRTLLNSLDFWRRKNMHPQGYLRYLEGFVKQLGVSVRRYEPGAELDEELDDEDEDEDED
jgi:hypothetical protein